MRNSSISIYSVLLCLSFLLFGFVGCAGQIPSGTRDDTILGKRLPHTGDYYLHEASDKKSPSREKYQLLAAQAFLQTGELATTQKLLDSLAKKNLPTNLSTQLSLLKARLKLMSNHAKQALSSLDEVAKKKMAKNDKRAFLELMAVAHARSGNHLASIIERDKLSRMLPNNSAKQQNYQAIWQSLQQLNMYSLRGLRNDRRFKKGSRLRGWFELAYLARKYSDDEIELSVAVNEWKRKYPKHPGYNLLTGTIIDPGKLSNKNGKQTVVLLLPLHGKLAAAGKAVKNGFMTAFYNDRRSRRENMDISILDTSRSQGIKALYQKAIS